MRIVLCDENRILCEALGSALEAWGHQAVAITATAADVLAAVNEHRPDLVILDPGVPAGPAGAGPAGAGPVGAGPVGAGPEVLAGLSAAGALRRGHPDTAVLLLSGLVDRATWSAAMRIGVAGYLCKNQNLGQIAHALDVVAAGGVVFDPAVPGQVSSRRPARRPAPLYQLTPREKEVLQRIVAGESTTQMAREMNIAIDTLRSYVKNVLAKLGTHTRLQAAALATREDLLSELSA